jgi:hypothetical protein
MARSGAWASVKNALRTAGVTTPASSFDEEEERRRREAQTQELYNSYASEVNNAEAFGQAQSGGNAEAFGQAQSGGNASWGGSQSNNMSPWQRAKQSMAAGRYSDIEDPLENLREFASRKAEADRQAAAGFSYLSPWYYSSGAALTKPCAQFLRWEATIAFRATAADKTAATAAVMLGHTATMWKAAAM